MGVELRLAGFGLLFLGEAEGVFRSPVADGGFLFLGIGWVYVRPAYLTLCFLRSAPFFRNNLV
jgi:hypothetical protein